MDIDSWDKVPSFASEKEEQAWWDEHDISEELLETFEPRSERSNLQDRDAPTQGGYLGEDGERSGEPPQDAGCRQGCGIPDPAAPVRGRILK